MLVVASVLLFGTITTLLLYYRRILDLRKEYNEAKGVVDDIVLSVKGQFRKQKDSVLFVTQLIENILVENKKVEEKVGEYDRQLIDLTRSIANVPQIEERVSGQLKVMQKEVELVKNGQEEVMKKLIDFEKIKQITPVPEVKIEAAIPIKKEKALEPLTVTELRVLEMISKEGEKTAPEIKEKIGLTREHTARLMKKLYKNGYLERNTHKMPYVYQLKEEMEKILKKRENNVS